MSGGLLGSFTHVQARSVAALVAGIALIAGSARADTGTYSGSITPTACGPMHPVNVAAGETTIDATAAADGLGERHHARPLQPRWSVARPRGHAHEPGVRALRSRKSSGGNVQPSGLPIPGRGVAEPYSYTGTFATSDAPVVGPPGSTPGGPGKTPRHQAMSPASSSSVPRLSWMLSEPKASR